MRPHVHILMCTKNGGAFLVPQLRSILAQTHKEWSLWISDDGSTDGTVEKIRSFMFANRDRDIRLFEGPRLGCAQNFLSLLARPGLDASWIAFADQDDLWMPHKIARAVNMIWRGTGAQIYACRSVCTDADLNVIGMSARYKRPFGFGNALVQNVLPGNTVMMPPPVTDFLRSIVDFAQGTHLPFHDWWAYQVVSGAGFDVIHDERPGIFYRQHGNNILGAQRGHATRRMKILMRRVFALWLDQNLSALHELAPVLDPRSRRLLFDFMDWRATPRHAARPDFASIGLYRQSYAGDVALRAMARLGRL